MNAIARTVQNLWTNLWTKLWAELLAEIWAEILKFGAVGVAGALSDVILTNVLWQLAGRSATAEVTAALAGTLFATGVAYLGNRFWTFRKRPNADVSREIRLFLLVSLIGGIFEIGCVFVSSSVFGFHGALADNVAKFGVGLPLGGAFRFWALHMFVFPEAAPAAHRAVDNVPHAAPADALPAAPAYRVGAATGE